MATKKSKGPLWRECPQDIFVVRLNVHFDPCEGICCNSVQWLTGDNEIATESIFYLSNLLKGMCKEQHHNKCLVNVLHVAGSCQCIDSASERIEFGFKLWLIIL